MSRVALVTAVAPLAAAPTASASNGCFPHGSTTLASSRHARVFEIKTKDGAVKATYGCLLASGRMWEGARVWARDHYAAMLAWAGRSQSRVEKSPGRWGVTGLVVALLLLAYFYAWGKGVFRWD